MSVNTSGVCTLQVCVFSEGVVRVAEGDSTKLRARTRVQLKTVEADHEKGLCPMVS